MPQPLGRNSIESKFTRALVSPKSGSVSWNLVESSKSAENVKCELWLNYSWLAFRWLPSLAQGDFLREFSFSRRLNEDLVGREVVIEPALGADQER